MKILYVEDNPMDIDLTRRSLKRTAPHIDMDAVSCQKEALTILKGPDFNIYDLILTDMRLPDGDGIAILSFVRSRSIPSAVVILTSQGNEETAVAVLKSGADDYIIKKPGYLDHLPVALENALTTHKAGTLRRNRLIQVLYLEHNSADIDFTRRHMGQHAPHITLHTTETVKDFFSLCNAPEQLNQFNVMLIDYRLPGANALEILKYLRLEKKCDTPMILVTGKGDEEIAIKALKIGAFDYITKNSGYLHKLPFIIENAVYSHEQSREHQALRESEARYKTLVDNIGIGICMINRSMEIVSANRQLKAWFPQINHQIKNQCSTMFCNPSEPNLPQDCPARRAFRDGKIHKTTIETLVDRKKRVFHMVATPIHGDGDEIHQVIEMIDDITERHNHQEQRLILETQLLQAQKHEALGNLAGGIAHDFNNLLATILGYSELALEDVEKGSLLEQEIKEIYTAGLRARDLTRQILTFAKKSASRPAPVQLSHVVTETLGFLKSTVPSSITLCHTITSDAMIMADTTQIHQIIMNLCTNAVQAMEEEGTLDISLSDILLDKIPPDVLKHQPGIPTAEHDTPRRYLKLTIRDSGDGIPEKNLPFIFEPYFTTKMSGRGTGLGLAVVQGIVHGYGGWITVESRRGEGTCFNIFLPTTSASMISDHGNVKEKELPSGNERILVVDDEAPITEMIATSLTKASYRVFPFSDSLTALEYIKSRPRNIDLVITDMTMPGLTGDKLAERIHQYAPDLPIIIATGFSTRISRDNDRLCHVAALLDKPVSRQKLLKTVRRVLDNVGKIS